MEITVETRPFTTIETEALVTYVFEDNDPVQGRVAELDQACGGALRKLSSSGELTAKWLETTLVHFPAGLAPQRLLLIGAGKRDKFNVAQLRKLAGAALRYLKARKIARLAFLSWEADRNSASAQAITEGLLVAHFEPDKYKTEKKNGKEVEAAALAGWDAANCAEAEQGIERGRIVAESQNFTRELVNEPSNRLTPRILAERAAAMAREVGLATDVLDESRIEELKMGALLAGGEGSTQAPPGVFVTPTPPQGRPGGPGVGAVGQGGKIVYR